MAPDPLISVCIPSYNHGRFLTAAIESVLAQTYRNFELVIVDDGSTDGSLDILERYSSRYPGTVKYFSHPGRVRRGVSTTANLAIQRSHGEFWCGLSSDDAFCANKLERQLGFMQAHPEVGLLYGTVIAIDEHGRPLHKVKVKDISCDPNPLVTLLEWNWIYGQTVMLRRECFERVGLHDEELIYSDWELWIRILAHYQVGFLPEPVAFYRIHKGNTSVGSPPQVQLQRHLDVMRQLRLKAPVGAGGLAAPLTRVVLELQLAFLMFCAGDRAAAVQHVRAALQIDPQMFRRLRFLAGWTLRRHSDLHIFMGKPAVDFFAWFIKVAIVTLVRMNGGTPAGPLSRRRRGVAKRGPDQHSGPALTRRHVHRVERNRDDRTDH